MALNSDAMKNLGAPTFCDGAPKKKRKLGTPVRPMQKVSPEP